MIVLFTDFGSDGIYTGQVHAVLAQEAPGVPVINLTHQAPQFNIHHASYLLAAYIRKFPQDAVVMAVVDPGVGGDRKAIVMRTEKRWYVGPDNGLFEMVARNESVKGLWQIDTADSVYDSFHGRDVFAPIVAKIARGWRPAGKQLNGLTGSENGWPDDLYEIIYIDHYGNLITGINVDSVNSDDRFLIRGHEAAYARVFTEAGQEQLFWYRNSNDLVEISVRQASAEHMTGAVIGEKIEKK